MPFRGFVAVPVPADAALTALLEDLAHLRADVKPVTPAHLHFTLSFLGTTQDEARPALEDALGRATQGAPAFDAQLRGVGAFPSARRPRVVWVGVEDPRPLVALALRAREELALAGHTGDEKDFRAHLTLARVKSERGVDEVVRWLQVHASDPLPSIPIREVCLYESKLSPAGPTYTALARSPLEA